MDTPESLVRYYGLLRQYGLNDSHSGNGSFRIDGDVYITPTGACTDNLGADQIVRISMADEPVPSASQDQRLHRAVYRHNPDACAVLHSHNPFTVALTLNNEDFIPVDLEGQLYFPRVPVISISYRGYFEHSPILVATQLAEFPVVVVRGHGVYAQGKTLDEAFKWLNSLEQSAKVAFLARQAGTFSASSDLISE